LADRAAYSRDNNPRTHSPEQVAQIAASIREWGWTNPILVDGEGGILAGHARVQAARKLRMTEVPVIVLRHLSEAQRRALVIADNQLALNSGWDEEMLRIELRSCRKRNTTCGSSASKMRNLRACWKRRTPRRA
jgi:ParB-like chromosome segregation protein Spo0J